MKQVLIFLFIFAVLISSLHAFQDLSGKWRYIESSDDWSSRKISEYGGDVVRVPSHIKLSQPGSQFWLQTEFQLNPQAEKSFHLAIGDIKDVDEVFLNGVQIGKSGEFPPEFSSSNKEVRIYTIPDSLLLGNNLLAIKIYSQGDYAGITKYPIGIFTSEELEQELIVRSVPHRSIESAPFSNGVALAEYNFNTCSINSALSHIYQSAEPGNISEKIAEQIEIQIMAPDSVVNLMKLKSLYQGYISGTGIVHHKLQHPEFTLNIYVFSPFQSKKAVLVVCATFEGDNVLPYTPVLKVNFPSVRTAWREEFYRQQESKSYYTAAIAWSEDGKKVAQNIANRFLKNYPHLYSLRAEIEFWESWQSTSKIPSEITPLQTEIYKQSLAILKMSQCREENAFSGQIISSLNPNSGNITLVRDLCYSIDALIQSGHYEEARNAMQFILNAKTGRYQDVLYKGRQMGIGSPYLVSVQGYYGSGLEFSDTTGGSPRICLDGFGLFLSVFRQFIDKTEDIDFLRYYWDLLKNRVAEPLLRQITEDQILRESSGPNYDPLPGRKFTMASATAVKGLMDASWLAYRLNDQVNAQRFEQASLKLNRGVLSVLVDPYEITLKDFAIVNRPEQYMGLYSVETLNWFVPIKNPYYQGTINAYKKYLKMSYTGNGFRESTYNQETGEYECVPMEIRLIPVLKKSGHTDEASRLLDWVTEQAVSNYGLIPEYYSTYSADYMGNIPVVGMGAGIYIISFWK